MAGTFRSAHFGTLDIHPDSVLTFPAGMPGFEDLRRFTILDHPEQPALIFLQSLERPGLCFLTAPVEVLRPDYELLISEEDLELLGVRDTAAGGFKALAVLSLVEGEEPTANLLSPVVIHTASGQAVQAIRPDQRYTCRERLACS